MTKAEQEPRIERPGVWWYVGKSKCYFHVIYLSNRIEITTKSIRKALIEMDTELETNKKGKRKQCPNK
jgi:hypothetical protein